MNNKVAIDLTNSSLKVYVDEEDYALVSARKWRLMNTGYVSSGYMKNGFSNFALIHRFILGLGPGRKPEVDHIDRDKLNNCRANLRLVDRATNIQNTGDYARTHSLPKGVYLYSHGYRAMVRDNGKLLHLGTFSTVEDAAQARARWVEANWNKETDNAIG